MEDEALFKVPVFEIISQHCRKHTGGVFRCQPTGSETPISTVAIGTRQKSKYINGYRTVSVAVARPFTACLGSLEFKRIRQQRCFQFTAVVQVECLYCHVELLRCLPAIAIGLVQREQWLHVVLFAFHFVWSFEDAGLNHRLGPAMKGQDYSRCSEQNSPLNTPSVYVYFGTRERKTTDSEVPCY